MCWFREPQEATLTTISLDVKGVRGGPTTGQLKPAGGPLHWMPWPAGNPDWLTTTPPPTQQLHPPFKTWRTLLSLMLNNFAPPPSWQLHSWPLGSQPCNLPPTQQLCLPPHSSTAQQLCQHPLHLTLKLTPTSQLYSANRLASATPLPAFAWIFSVRPWMGR